MHRIASKWISTFNTSRKSILPTEKSILPSAQNHLPAMVKLPFQKRGLSKIQIQIQIHLFCHIMHFCPDKFICQPQLIFHSRFVSKLNFSSYKASAVHLIGNERGKKYYKKQSTDGSGSEISAAQRHRLYHLSVLSLQGSPEYNTSTDT